MLTDNEKALNRFLSKVLFLPETMLQSPCWIWTAAKTSEGYGSFKIDTSRSRAAHRWLYELINGVIPKRLTLDHLCRTRACVNPDHLEAVTNRENILRGVGACARNSRKTHCKHGHEFTTENTLAVRGGGRACRMCAADNLRRFHERRAQAN